MKLVFVNRYFAPDSSATSQMVGDLCRHLARGGREVHVVTSRQLHDRPEARLPAEESIDAVRVHRVWTTRFGRMNLAGRAIDYATFYAAAAWRLSRLATAADVIIAKTDPPLVSVVASWVAARRGARLVNWVQDVFPETAAHLGVRGTSGWPGRILARLRDASLDSAVLNVAVGERMAAHLRARAPGAQVSVVHNWSDGSIVRPVPRERNALRRDWRLGDRFVVGYSGNLGRAHDFDTVLGACERLRDRADIVFLFIGGGPQRRKIESEAARRHLGNIVFRPLQPRETLGESLGVPDLHLVTLQPSLEGLVVPSKFYGIAAAGRPVLFVGDPAGEIAGLVESARCGVSVETGDTRGLAVAIERLCADRSRAEECGRNAREFFERRFDMPRALADWDRIIERVAGGGLPM